MGNINIFHIPLHHFLHFRIDLWKSIIHCIFYYYLFLSNDCPNFEAIDSVKTFSGDLFNFLFQILSYSLPDLFGLTTRIIKNNIGYQKDEAVQ